MFSFLQKKPNFIIRLTDDTGVPPIPVYDKKIIIGRGNNHVLAIPDASISRNHVEITFRDGEILVTDLGTSNGTKLDGHPIPPSIPVPYSEGQVLQLGQSEVSIRFEFFRK
jgi:pSer/pThr/pTyr-binding forkhead associated (FHA) protein